MDAAAVALVLVEFAACGYSLPDADGRTRFEPAPNIERIWINVRAVTSVTKLREGSDVYGGGDIQCAVIHGGGERVTVLGTAEEVVGRLESAVSAQQD